MNKYEWNVELIYKTTIFLFIVSIGLAFIVQTFGKSFLLFLAIKHNISHVAHCLLTVLHLSLHSFLALCPLCFLRQLFPPFHVSHTVTHRYTQTFSCTGIKSKNKNWTGIYLFVTSLMHLFWWSPVVSIFQKMT